MKTCMLLIFVSFGLFFLSCEKISRVITKTDSLDVTKHNPIKTDAETVTFLKSLNKTDVLTKFFQPYKIINDTAHWKQDLESMEMKISDDSYIHTVIDTVFNSGTSYIILFATYETFLNGKIHYCHPCNVDYSIANVVKDGDYYKVKSFKKQLTTKGTMGQGANVTFVKFKDSTENTLTCLKFEDGWIGGGTMMSAAEYFNTEDFSSLIYIETHNSNEGMCDETAFKCINKTEREIIPFNSHSSNHPAIIIKCRHTYYDKKLIMIEKSDTLIYDGYHFNKNIYYKGV